MTARRGFVSLITVALEGVVTRDNRLIVPGALDLSKPVRMVDRVTTMEYGERKLTRNGRRIETEWQWQGDGSMPMLDLDITTENTLIELPGKDDWLAVVTAARVVGLTVGHYDTWPWRGLG